MRNLQAAQLETPLHKFTEQQLSAAVGSIGVNQALDIEDADIY